MCDYVCARALFRQSIYPSQQSARVCVCVWQGQAQCHREITLSVYMSLRLPPAASLLSLAAQIKELTHAPMSSLSPSPLSLSRYLSCDLNPLPLSLTLSFCPYMQVPPRLYQWGFWLHYRRGQSFLCRQGEWRNGSVRLIHAGAKNATQYTLRVILQDNTVQGTVCRWLLLHKDDSFRCRSDIRDASELDDVLTEITLYCCECIHKTKPSAARREISCQPSLSLRKHFSFPSASGVTGLQSWDHTS